MRPSKPTLLALAALSIAATAEACMMGVPWQLFDHRREIQTATPINSFAWEASHLVPPTAPPPTPGDDKPNGVVSMIDGQPTYTDLDDYQHRRVAAENQGLNPIQQATLKTTRAAPTAETALAAGATLPPAIRLYTAGAIAFAHDDLPEATRRFTAILHLPPAEAAPRAVWASYMLARTAKDSAAEAAAYLQTRTLAAQGAPDPLNLANASLGDEARLHLGANDTKTAIALYAQQAANGSPEAIQSLRIVAESLMAKPDTLRAAVRDPLTLRLLVVHALALAGDYLHQLHTGGTVFEIPYDGFFEPDSLDTKPLAALFAAIQESGGTTQAVDQLAALAYQLNEYPAADALAKLSHTPLALWIQAKIALQTYDDPRAASLMAQALHAATQPGTPPLEPATRTLLQGEAATWSLKAADFKQAMATLWPVADTYWGDVAYLAERVLTTDELKAFVENNAPPLAAEPPEPTPITQLRALLARRLMRDARPAEALPYFDTPKTRDPATAYTTALYNAQTAFLPSTRAQANWTAALLLRRNGMDLMGTETLPDNRGVDGYYASTGYGPGPGGPAAQIDERPTQDELARYDASRPRPDLRFHYRYLAADQALQAAHDLPPRTQAYAAILCRASQWMLSSRANERATAIYRQYRENGALVPFATHFGYGCPDPDFAAVPATRRKLALIDAHDLLHRHKLPFAAAALLLLTVTTAAILGIRRR